MISFAVFTGIGAILLFRETLVFFGRAFWRRHPDRLAALRRQPVAARSLLPAR